MNQRDIALDLYNAFKGGRKSFFANNKKTSLESQNEVRENNEPKAIGELINQLVNQGIDRLVQRA